MNIQEFFDTFLGLWVETNRGDISTNQQCVDLWRAYNQKVIGGPFMYGNAVDFWTNYPLDFYEKIPNTPDGFPKLGDVVIWGTRYGKYGHIAICTDISDVKGFTSFDQNDPLNSACHFQPHTYTGVLGWLRPKDQGVVIGQPEQNTVLNVILEAYKALPEGDPLKPGNLEGYARAIVEEHKNYGKFEGDSKLLWGFITKWAREWQLNDYSDLVEIEQEMNKLLPAENSANAFREAIEKLVGEYENDEHLLKVMETFKEAHQLVKEKLTDCQTKLTNRKVLKAFELGSYLIKIYRK